MKNFLSLFFFVFTLLFLSCKEDSPILVTSITLNETSLMIFVGYSETLTAVITPSDATNKKVTWQSSDNDVVTVDSNGKITGRQVGSATITASTEDGSKKATCTVNVESGSVDNILLNKRSLELKKGDNETLIVKFFPEYAVNKRVTWKSSNSIIATVDHDGNIKAMEAGSATITATTQDGNKSYSCVVTVFDKINTFTDERDGTLYKYVTIGSQVWMAENLKYLPSVSGPNTFSTTEPCYYVYDYVGKDVKQAKTSEMYKVYGVLYNKVAATMGTSNKDANSSSKQSICPKGWHVPNYKEWNQLKEYLNCDIKKLAGKLKSTSHWEHIYYIDPLSTNETGFTALPGGRRDDGTFRELGVTGAWWADIEWYPSNPEEVYIDGGVWEMHVFQVAMEWIGNYRIDNNRALGVSVRCIRDKDNSESGTTFDLKLTDSPTNSGSLNGSGVYEEGAYIKITAAAKSGYIFTGWSGDTDLLFDKNEKTTALIMPAKDLSVTANFTKE